MNTIFLKSFSINNTTVCHGFYVLFFVCFFFCFLCFSFLFFFMVGDSNSCNGDSGAGMQVAWPAQHVKKRELNKKYHAPQVVSSFNCLFLTP